MCIVQRMLVQWGGRGGAGITKEDRKGDRQTDRMKGSKRIMARCRRRTVSREGYNPKKEGWEGGEGESPDTIIRQEPERPRMQNTGDGTQKGGRRGQRAVCKTKRKVWWLGRLVGEGRP